jgi:hypothetical protein
MRRVHETIVVVEKQYYTFLSVCANACVCVCVCVCVSVWVGGCGCAVFCLSVCVALLIQHETRGHITICDLFDSTVFFDIFSYMARFSKKKKCYWAQNMYFDFL